MEDIKNKKLNEKELESVSGGECIRRNGDGTFTWLKFDDAPSEGVAIFLGYQRCTLNVGGIEGTCIEAVTDDGVLMYGIEAEQSIGGDIEPNRIRFKKIDRDKDGSPQYWFYFS